MATLLAAAILTVLMFWAPVIYFMGWEKAGLLAVFLFILMVGLFWDPKRGRDAGSKFNP